MNNIVQILTDEMKTKSTQEIIIRAQSLLAIIVKHGVPVTQ